MKAFSLSEKENRIINVLLAVLLLISGITSIVIFPAYSFTVTSYIFVYTIFPLFFWFSFKTDKAFVKEFFIITAVFIGINIIAQLQVYFNGVVLTEDLILVKKDQLEKTLLRPTLFSQSILLFAGILTYLYLKYFAKPTHLKWLYWGLRVIVFYGFLELILFYITGKNGDFLSNRVFDKPGSGSRFQTITIAGTALMRLKSLTGEASMFSFVIVPFWIMAFYLKRYFDFIFFGIALLLTLSTSAIMGIVVFGIGFLAVDERYRKKALLGILAVFLITTAAYFLNRNFNKVIDVMLIDKLTGENESGLTRFSKFSGQMHYWKTELGFWGKMFGIGFGYTRSTDFFSTLLVNNGIIGFLLFSWFYFKHAFIRFTDITFKKYYIVALIAIYIIMMASVPEFAYLSLWILLSMPYWNDEGERMKEQGLI